MNAIGTYGASAQKCGGVGFVRKTTEKESGFTWMIGFLNPEAAEKESNGKAKADLSTGAAEQVTMPSAKTSIEKSQQEYALFLERVQKQEAVETAEEKALRERKWEYVKCFPTLGWSEADKKRIFNNKQVRLDGDGSETLTENQIALLRSKYDIRHLTAEDAYYLMCDLTEMNVFSSEECEHILWGTVIEREEDLNKLHYATEEGLWAYMWDEELGQNILVNTNWSLGEDVEEEDPELIKARVKGYTDDILLAAFGAGNVEETDSPEDLRSEQTLKENAEGITGELEAILTSGVVLTEDEIFNGGANSGFLMDVAITRWNAKSEVKGITQAYHQDPEAAAWLLPQYQRKYDACDKFLKLVDQLKR